MFLYGKNSVKERLRHHPSSVKEVYLRQGFQDVEMEQLIGRNNIRLKRVSDKDIERMLPKARTQGILAKVDDYQGYDLDQILNNPKWIILFLDHIMDPHNLGCITRIAACFGDIAICIPKHRACGITDTVIHVASGGENYAPIIQVSNISNAIIKAKQAGYWIASTVVEGGDDLSKSDLPRPLGVVLGAEGDGVGKAIQKHVDYKLTIPMQGAPLSFNVAMSAAIICYQLRS